MRKILSTLLVVVMLFSFGIVANAESTYSAHLTGANEYDITDNSIAWVKQAKGALIWVEENDTRSNDEIINEAKSADPSLANAVREFDVLRGEGIKYTPNTNGSQAKIIVSYKDGKLYLHIDGKYSHFVKGGTTVNNIEEKQEETTEETGEKVNLRVDTAKKMAVKFDDGEVYYNGDMKEVVVGKEYTFQIASVNWENGIYDENSNGLCGTVVYRMKVVHDKEFKKLREEALKNPDRYTVKGMDIIDNEGKYIYINCDAKDFHLETDVNNFFMAYRFHFKQDYNKQTGIANVVKPTESLSVNLPLGTTVCAKTYHNFEFMQHAYILIVNNNGKGVYENEYLTSVNDFYWDSQNHYKD